MNILIVDDIEENQYLLSSLLIAKNYKVFEAANGLEAINVLKNNDIEVIISDVLMPLMDGFSLCREVKNNPEWKDIPFIVYTATYTGPKDEELALELGADKFIIKPCEPELFLVHLQDVILKSKNKNCEKESNELEETEVLKLYNERLIRKLEQKMLLAEKEIIAREEAERQLIRNQKLLSETQRIAKIGGWEWDIDKQKLFWTEQVYLIHGLEDDNSSGQELIQKSLNCYPHEDRQKVKKAFEECIVQGTPYEIECYFNTYSGKQLYIQTAGQAVFENNNIVKIRGYIRDITETKNNQLEKEMLNEQLIQSQKLESLGQLAGGIAHDFNNILNVIIGYSEILLNSVRNKQKEINEILKAGHRATELIKQLLLFSRTHTFSLKIINLNSLINDLEKMLKRLMGEKISIKTILTDNLMKIKIDPGYFNQILMNLVINARDAMPDGGEIVVKTANIYVEEDFLSEKVCLNKGNFVMLEVSDTGTGIPKEIQQKIFEPFFTTKQADKGTGLGLSTVYGIVTKSDGVIALESEIGKGSCFQIYFPEAVSKNNENQEVNDISNIQGNGELIVVAEDEDSVRDLLHRLLVKLGYRVISAENGQKLLDMIESLNDKPFLLISDIVMQGLNGDELYKLVKNIYPDLKILFMSGYSDSFFSDSEKFFKDHPFIQKPFTINEIGLKIKNLL